MQSPSVREETEETARVSLLDLDNTVVSVRQTHRASEETDAVTGSQQIHPKTGLMHPTEVIPLLGRPTVLLIVSL